MRKTLMVTRHLVKVDEMAETGFSMEKDHTNFSVSGQIVEAGRLLPKVKPGDQVLFQYNAHLEGEYLEEYLLLHPDYIYMIGDRAYNGWVMYNYVDEDRGIVRAVPKGSFIKPGQTIWFKAKSGHQLELPTYNTLNPEGYHSIMAIPMREILMYA